MNVKSSNTKISCPCDSSKDYASCCQQHHQSSPAPSAEVLMRSRYSAYALGLEQYLLDTWHPDTRPTALNLGQETAVKWLGLDVKRVENTSSTSATVEFVARYRVGGNKAERLHEVSQFVFTNRWYYLSGKIE